MTESVQSLRALTLFATVCMLLDDAITAAQVSKGSKGAKKWNDVRNDLERSLAAVEDDIYYQSHPSSPLVILTTDSTAFTKEVIVELQNKQQHRLKSVIKGIALRRGGNDRLEQALHNSQERLISYLKKDLQDNVLETLNGLTARGITTGEWSVLHSTIKSVQATLAAITAPTLLNELLHQLETTLAIGRQAAVLSFLGVGSERIESIAAAEAKTFQWLLDRNEPVDPMLDTTRQQFLSWLQDGSGFFFISGKPGAGKSTLLKFISNHLGSAKSTISTSYEKLLFGRFFLWKPGRKAQKTISGLIRGMLSSIVEASDPSIAGILLPDVCSLLESADAVEQIDIQQVFSDVLARAVALGYTVLLMVDALDELEGSFSELLDLMQSWILQFPASIKILVSGRPYQIFEQYFSKSPGFRLQDITQQDQTRLIVHRLRDNKTYSVFLPENKTRVEQLVREKAGGVFLSVAVIVGMIEDGLVAGRLVNFKEVESSILQCPDELEDLLPHILESIQESERVWAFRAIALILFAQFSIPDILLSDRCDPGVGLLDLMLLDEASSTWDLSIFRPRSENLKDISTRLEAARMKVISRCKGFLSVVTTSSSTWPSNGQQRQFITLTHRSVVEFLTSETAMVKSKAYLPRFSPAIAMLSTVLACLRYVPPSNYPLLKQTNYEQSITVRDMLHDSLQQRWKELCKCGMATGEVSSSKFCSLLDEMASAVKRQLVLQLPARVVGIAVTPGSIEKLLVDLTLEIGMSEYSEWRQDKGQTRI